MKPVLVKKALPRHWSKDFDTVEEAMREAQAARMASKRELGNIEDIPITPGTLEWELGLTRDGKARSLIPGVSAGRVIDQGLVDQGGAFAYPALRQSFFPSLHPEVTGRRAGVPLGRGSENMMMFTTEKPRLHATQKEGREQTEAFYPGGFDPTQTYLLSDPTRTFRRNDLEEANRAFMGRNESNYAEGTEGADTPVGRIVAPMSNLVSSSQNPLTVQPWGRPQTVEDVFQLSEPMEIAMRLLKAYLPTLQERGRKIDDQVSLRWIPRYHERTFHAPVPFYSSKGNVNWEKRLQNEKLKASKDSPHSQRKTLPGVFEGDSKTPSNKPITGSWVAPATQQGAMGADVSFNDRGILMAINENPDWWRTVQQGAAIESPGGEGFKYGGFDKEAFSKIPTPNLTPISMLYYQMALENPMLEEDEVAQRFPDEHELITQFPNIKTEDIWGPPDELTINPLKVASEPMDIAFQLLKEDPLHLQSSNTLARRAREELETDKMGENSPAYQEMMERMMEMYEPQDETIPLEENLDQYAQETGKNPWRMLPGREMPNKYGGTAKVHLDPLTPIHPQQFYDWQAKNASEPMEIAMQLLKERVSPEAKRHKLEYDKKYESSPERVKYREDLNRERRRRGIYGSHDHKDISHTEGGKLTLEGEHENRARHFKDKGTLREL
jgi:hypothetical protein